MPVSDAARKAEDILLEEEWRDIPGYEGWYQVSSFGKAKRSKGGPSTRPGREMKPWTDSGGYLQVELHCGEMVKTESVHKLVMISFLGVPPPGLEINHIDGNKKNNYISNLEYVTKSQNIRHAYKTGSISPKRGESNGNSKLSLREVEEIRKRSAAGDRMVVLSKEFGVGRTEIYNIVRGKTWGPY
jgi:hypothetical protein